MKNVGDIWIDIRLFFFKTIDATVSMSRVNITVTS